MTTPMLRNVVCTKNKQKSSKTYLNFEQRRTLNLVMCYVAFLCPFKGDRTSATLEDAPKQKLR
jgi:hypothetical protein